MSDEEEESSRDVSSNGEIEEEEDLERITKAKSKSAKKAIRRNEFIDDEAELSGDDEVSEDEDEGSDDDDQIDPELIDQDAPELDSDQEEEVRGMYFKQLENEDRRAVLLMKEKLEDKDIALGQRRRKKFKWQTADIMETSLRRHYDPDDDDSQGEDDDDDDALDDADFEEVAPRLKRPTAESFLLGSSRIMGATSVARSSSRHPDLVGVAGPSGMSDDSNSNTISSRLTGGGGGASNGPMDINRFLFRDKEIVAALSTKEVVVATREEKDRAIEREIKRVLQSKSIFDQLYT